MILLIFLRQNNYKNISFTGKKEAINMSAVKEYNTQNNYRLITTDSKTDNVNILLKIFTDNEFDAKPSAKFVLSELLNRGSVFQKQEEMDSNLAQIGIEKNFGAKNQTVTCVIECDTETIPQAFANLKEVMDNPRFTEEEFQKAKELIKDLIKTEEKSAFDKLESELFKGLPNGYSKEEILKDLDTLKLDDIKKLYSNILSNGKGIISISAPIDRKPEIKNTIFNGTSILSPVKEFNVSDIKQDFKKVEQTKVLSDTYNKNQAEIIEAFKFKINDNIKDHVTVKLLNIILGGNPSSRLFMDLREKEKLAYQVKSSYSKHNDIGLFTLQIGTTTDNKQTGEKHFENVQKSIEGFNRHIEKIKTEKVSQEELKSAKLYLKNLILNDNQSPAYKALSLANDVNTPYSIYRTNMLLDEIDKITADDIYNAANYIFNQKPTYSILATQDTINANENYLKTLEN